MDTTCLIKELFYLSPSFHLFLIAEYFLKKWINLFLVLSARKKDFISRSGTSPLYPPPHFFSADLWRLKCGCKIWDAFFQCVRTSNIILNQENIYMGCANITWLGNVWLQAETWPCCFDSHSLWLLSCHSWLPPMVSLERKKEYHVCTHGAHNRTKN